MLFGKTVFRHQHYLLEQTTSLFTNKMIKHTWQIRLTKNVSANFILSGDGLEKVQKQGRDDRAQEDYLTSVEKCIADVE